MKKHIIALVISLLACAVIAVLFFTVIHPAFLIDYDALYKKELEAHEAKLEIIQNDLNQALKYDNVELIVDNDGVSLRFKEKYCVLNVKMTKELKVVEYSSINKANDELFGIDLLTALCAIAALFAFICFVGSIVSICRTAKENRHIKLLANLEKKADVNIIV